MNLQIKYCLMIISCILFLNSMIMADFYSVLVDAGHGGSAPGTGPAVCDGNILEKHLNLDYCISTCDKIDGDWSHNWISYKTRNDDSFVSNTDRALMANNETGGWVDADGYLIPEYGVDYFLSIHCNASLQHNASGTEVLYYNSGDYRAEQSIMCATVALQYFLEETKEVFLGASSRWIKERSNITVIKETCMASVLVETEFMDFMSSCNSMITSEYEEAVGWGLNDAVGCLNPEESLYINMAVTSDITTFEAWYSGTYLLII